MIMWKPGLKASKKILFSRIAVWDFIRALHHFVQVCIFNYKLRHLNRLNEIALCLCVLLLVWGKIFSAV